MKTQAELALERLYSFLEKGLTDVGLHMSDAQCVVAILALDKIKNFIQSSALDDLSKRYENAQMILDEMAIQLETSRILLSVNVHPGHLAQIDDALAKYRKGK